MSFLLHNQLSLYSYELSIVMHGKADGKYPSSSVQMYQLQGNSWSGAKHVPIEFVYIYWAEPLTSFCDSFHSFASSLSAEYRCCLKTLPSSKWNSLICIQLLYQVPAPSSFFLRPSTLVAVVFPTFSARCHPHMLATVRYHGNGRRSCLHGVALSWQRRCARDEWLCVWYAAAKF